jgi:hypothetical protein
MNTIYNTYRNVSFAAHNNPVGVKRRKKKDMFWERLSPKHNDGLNDNTTTATRGLKHLFDVYDTWVP